MGRPAARIRVLGSCGAWPEPGRACAGFLVEHDGRGVVLDLGYGTFTRLTEHLDGAFERLDAVVVSHAHPDHLHDVHPLHRALRYGGGPRLPLLGPPGVVPVLDAVEPDEPSPIRTSFTFTPLPADGPVRLGPWRLTSLTTPHHVPNVAVRLDGPGGSVVYTGDTAPHPPLAAFAAGCDLLVCEATDRHQGEPNRHDPMLMTGQDAGRLAARADAGAVLLTHFWPGNDRERTVAAAAGEFGGPVTAADEQAGDPIPVRPSRRA